MGEILVKRLLEQRWQSETHHQNKSQNINKKHFLVCQRISAVVFNEHGKGNDS